MCSAEQQTYNGWANYETWLANLWLTNDEGYYGQLIRTISSHGDMRDQAEALDEWMQLEHSELEITNLWSDIVAHTLSRVDWLEIIENNQA
jgi:hypothetical protein